MEPCLFELEIFKLPQSSEPKHKAKSSNYSLIVAFLVFAPWKVK